MSMNSAAVNDQTQQKASADVPSEDIHLLSFVIILSRRRKFILWFTAGMAALAVGVVLLLPNKYTAITSLLPPSQSSSVSSALMGQLAGSGALASMAGSSLGLKSPGDLYVSLLRSRTVEDSMVKRFGLISKYHVKKMSQARDAFESHTKVVLGTKDGLINISVTDLDAEQASELANGYVDEYRKLSANLAITEASQRRVFFQQQLQDAKQNLVTAEDAMKSMEQTTGILQIDSQARALVESAANLRAQVVAKEVQIQAMRSYATENNASIVLYEQQLAALKSQLAKLAGGDQDSGADVMVPRGKMAGAGMEYVRKLRDVKYYETIFELISKQLEMAKLDEAREGSMVQVVDVAVPPDTKSSPKRAIIVIAVVFIAFVTACLWSIFAERFRLEKDSSNDREYVDALRATFR
ncbi:GumC family protein [Acidicapsa ligni]|uniref:GumC family protein n=1 Tax=Acidicapsa ligni TaxID=542300 RepID=UPI0021E06FE5|nr:GNVR domain-containing protein [Acidicapsa ligni]